jgi:Holliday junction resolvase RusA-like endonuclease
MAQRIKNSLGSTYHNKGTRMSVNEGRYEVDRTREFYIFDVIPMGAPRMTQSDKWKTNPNHPDPKKRQRIEVTRYFAFKDILRLQANTMQFELPKVFEGVYFIPMPDSWSEKKKAKMNGFPSEPRPDTDNITKGIKDALRKSDSDIWFECAQKRWAYNGSILIYI